MNFPPESAEEQDWWLVMADENRIMEFCDVYESAELTDIERFCLMELIVASYDEVLIDKRENVAAWKRLTALQRRDWYLNRATAEYWSLLDEEDLENVFHLTPLMRQLWHEMESAS